jgi:hypothetical protein
VECFFRARDTFLEVLGEREDLAHNVLRGLASMVGNAYDRVARSI